MTDMAKDGVPRGALGLLLALRDYGKDLVADLFVKAMMEECADISELEEGMTDASMDRLLTLPSFRDFVARREAEIEAKSKAEGRAEALAEALMSALLTYFAAKSDTPSAGALATLRACDDPAILQNWLQRAYQGETSAQILESTPAS